MRASVTLVDSGKRSEKHIILDNAAKGAIKDTNTMATLIVRVPFVASISDTIEEWATVFANTLQTRIQFLLVWAKS